MSKNVLILSGSPRLYGNSDLLCDEFLKGAKEAGHEVEKIFLRNIKVAGCIGCEHCYKGGESTGICTIKDDMAQILDKMSDADVIVLASPVYFYSVGSQIKPL